MKTASKPVAVCRVGIAHHTWLRLAMLVGGAHPTSDCYCEVNAVLFIKTLCLEINLGEYP